MITVSIRVNHLIDLLNRISSENLEYGIWVTYYGEDWYKQVQDIASELNKLFEQKDAGYELSIDFNMRAAQILKMMILYYLEKNYFSIDKETMNDIIRIIITIDERIQSDLLDSLTQSIPTVRTNKNAR